MTIKKYNFSILPRNMIFSYALNSSSSQIVATRLAMDVLDIATKGQYKLKLVKNLRQKDISAQVIESLFIDSLKDILSWEKNNFSDSRECCLTFVDVALDALVRTSLEIIALNSKGLLPTSARIKSVFSKVSSINDNRRVISMYYQNFINQLLLFNLTQYVDLEVGPNKDIRSMDIRDLYFFSRTYPCVYAVSKLNMSLLETSAFKYPIDKALAHSREMTDTISKMPFVKGQALPKLQKMSILCGEESSNITSRRKKNILVLKGDPPNNNVIFRCDKIEDSIQTHLTEMGRDLIEVATYVYVADLLVHRTARWRRSLNFVIPVRNIKRWESVAADLSMIISFVTGDHVSFEFIRRHVKEKKKSFIDNPPSCDCICLLSGGMDSFAGALDLLKQKRQPMLISHFRQNLVAKHQRMLEDALQSFAVNVQGMNKLSSIRIDSGLSRGRYKSGFKGKLEPTQRTRSYLFLCLATAVADALKINEVQIPENGVIAINVPFAACRAGSRSTRTAHPRFLWYFENIINRLFDGDFKVRNPFIFRTKSEVLEVFKHTGMEKHIVDTLSCSRYWYGIRVDKRRAKRNCTHCGACLACLVRRAAIINAGLTTHDDGYVIQSYKQMTTLKKGERLCLLHLIDFCKKIYDKSDEQILIRHPQLFLPNKYFQGILGKGGIAAMEATKMYRRFSNEIITVVKETTKHSEETSLPLKKIFDIDSV